MVFGQDRLGGGEVLGELGQLATEDLEILHFLQARERGLVGFDVSGVVFEVLEFAGGVVGLEAFEELLGVGEEGRQLCGFRLREQVLAPEGDAAGKLLVGADEFFDPPVDDLVKLLNGLVALLAALSD